MTQVSYSHTVDESAHVGILQFKFNEVGFPDNLSWVVDEMFDDLWGENHGSDSRPAGVMGYVISPTASAVVTVVYDKCAFRPWDTWYKELALRLQVALTPYNQSIMRWPLKRMTSE